MPNTFLAAVRIACSSVCRRIFTSIPLSLPTCSSTIVRFGCIRFHSSLRFDSELVDQIRLFDVVHRALRRPGRRRRCAPCRLDGDERSREIAAARRRRTTGCGSSPSADEAAEVRLLLERPVEPRRRDLEAVVRPGWGRRRRARRELATDLGAVVEADALRAALLSMINSAAPSRRLVLPLEVDELVARPVTTGSAPGSRAFRRRWLS